MTVWTFGLVGALVALLGILIVQYLATTELQEWFGLWLFCCGGIAVVLADSAMHHPWWVLLDSAALLFVLVAVARRIFWSREPSDVGE